MPLSIYTISRLPVSRKKPVPSSWILYFQRTAYSYPPAPLAKDMDGIPTPPHIPPHHLPLNTSPTRKTLPPPTPLSFSPFISLAFPLFCCFNILYIYYTSCKNLHDSIQTSSYKLSAMWPNGKALDYDYTILPTSRDSRFDPWHGQFTFFFLELVVLLSGCI
jgi:hypothetical protein